MSAMDRRLDRLLKAAADAPQRQPTGLPYAVEARILSRWRKLPGDEPALGLVRLFRRGFALACVLMLVALAVSAWRVHQTATDALAVPNVVVQTAALP